MMKKFFLFSFILLVFLLPSIVFAEEQKIALSYLNGSQVIISNDMGADVQLARNTTNQNQMDIKTIIFTSNYNFKKNVLYEYEIETNNSYITNNTNKISLKGYNMSCNLISIQGYNTNYLQVRFTCPNDTSYILLSLSNLSGQNITTGYQIGWNSIYLWQITDTIDVSPIINNDNQNTQNIINNNNQNTQDIINNQNDIYYNYCDNLFNKNNITANSTFDSNGNIFSANGFFVGNDYISVKPNTNYTLDSFNGYRVVEYNSSKGFIQRLFDVKSFTTGSNTHFIRISGNSNNLSKVMLNEGTSPLPYCDYGSKVNKLDETTNSINNLDNTINDSSIGSSANDGASFLNNFSTDTFGLTAIITAPLSLIQSITSSSCSTLNLPLPYLNNKYLTLPCMSSIYQQYFGTLFTLYQTITFGVIAYWVCIRIFNLVKDFKNPEHDEIEVMDL